VVGLDTNVLVRYLAQDDARQAARATRLIDQELSAAAPGFVSLVVLVELCWVLKRLYAATEDELRETAQGLLDMPQLQLERRDVIQAVLRPGKADKRSKAGFADALITQTALEQGCAKVVSFDKTAVRDAGMTLLA
jgi:predicted nucleic-acid-binding protein